MGCPELLCGIVAVEQRLLKFHLKGNPAGSILFGENPGYLDLLIDEEPRHQEQRPMAVRFAQAEIVLDFANPVLSEVEGEAFVVHPAESAFAFLCQKARMRALYTYLTKN